MKEYLDSKGNKIQKGFYEYTDVIWYFTGKYIYGHPIFDKEIGRDISILFSSSTKKFNKLTEEKVKEIIKRLKIKINFLEEKLK